jgi:hypothetical protein
MAEKKATVMGSKLWAKLVEEVVAVHLLVRFSGWKRVLLRVLEEAEVGQVRRLQLQCAVQ